MITLTQTRFGAKDSKGKRLSYGNCLVTCIACLTHMPIEEVPNIQLFYDCKPNVKGLELWKKVLNYWLNSKFNLYLEIEYDVEKLPPTDYFIARGSSPRGTKHCILMSKTKPAWDVHPSQEGLVSIDHYYVLKQIPFLYGDFYQ